MDGANEEPVFTANKENPEAFDSAGVGSPMLVYLPNKKVWRMYYTGSSTQDGDWSITTTQERPPRSSLPK